MCAWYVHIQLAPCSHRPAPLYPALPLSDVRLLAPPLLRMDKLVEVNVKLIAIDNNDAIPAALKEFVKLPLLERMGSLLIRLYFSKNKDTGSVDLAAKEVKAGLVF